MKALRTGLVALLVVALSIPAAAGDLAQSAANAVAQEAARPAPARSAADRTRTWLGTALFAAGMTVGLYAFIHNENGKYSEFGEADAVNKGLGAAGLSTAFAGGVLIFLGTHKASASSSAVTVRPGRVSVSKRVTW